MSMPNQEATVSRWLLLPREMCSGMGREGEVEEVLMKETEKREERKVNDGQTPALPLSFLCLPTEGGGAKVHNVWKGEQTQMGDVT